MAAPDDLAQVSTTPPSAIIDRQRRASGSTRATFKRLFEPLTIGDFTVPNRIMNPTHGSYLSPERDIRYRQMRASGGAGLVGLQANAGVIDLRFGPGERASAPEWDRRGPSPLTPHGIAFYDDMVISHLRRAAAAIHAEGSKCFAQIAHGGAGRGHFPSHDYFALVAPSAVADPYVGFMPHPLTDEEIEELVFAHSHAIRRVAEAGVDAAELHAAHGYLMNEFFSPFFNQRTDRWGGSRDNRARFAVEIIAAARTLVGSKFPIGIRVGPEGDGVGRGITVGELTELAALLSPHLTYISVSGGNASGFGDGHEIAYVAPWYVPPAPNVSAAAAVKARVTIPVFVTGRIADPWIAEGVLADGAADMVGMVRALIADPDMPRKVRSGRADQVRMCLGISECHLQGPHRLPITCAVNASAGREGEMEIAAVNVPKTVVVVGAGPAGLEAARVAALRGHRVLLCDRSRTIGGTVALLAHDPNRRNLKDHAVYFEGELARLRVELLLGTDVTAEDLVQFGPDAVIVATGGTPLVPRIPGIAGPEVVTAHEVLRGSARVGGRVVVVGGHENHLGPPTIAEFLSDQGAEVEFISEQFEFAGGAEDATRVELMHRLLAKGVRISLLTRLTAVTGGIASVHHTFTDAERSIAGATVVLACGLLPDDRLAHELKGRIRDVYVVGDAFAPRRIGHATLEGARAGMAI